MKSILTASLTALALVLGSSALAATPAKPSMATCEGLMKQFDKAVDAHGKAPKLAQAKEMRGTGEHACKVGDYGKGFSDLHSALSDIGVKPAAK